MTISSLQFNKLVFQMGHHPLDSKMRQMHQQLEDPVAFWIAVKQSLALSAYKVEVLPPAHPLNQNVKSLFGPTVPPNIRNVFINDVEPMVVPHLLENLPSDQIVSIQLRGYLLDQYDEHTHSQLWLTNQLLCARLTSSKRWHACTQGYNSVNGESLKKMWIAAYQHLPWEDINHQVAAADVVPWKAVPEIYAVVDQRFPQHTPQWANAIIEWAANSCFAFMLEDCIKSCTTIWSQLNAEQWKEIKTDHPTVSAILQPFKDNAVLKANLLNAVSPSKKETKRKM